MARRKNAVDWEEQQERRRKRRRREMDFQELIHRGEAEEKAERRRRKWREKRAAGHPRLPGMNDL